MNSFIEIHYEGDYFEVTHQDDTGVFHSKDIEHCTATKLGEYIYYLITTE